MLCENSKIIILKDIQSICLIQLFGQIKNSRHVWILYVSCCFFQYSPSWHNFGDICRSDLYGGDSLYKRFKAFFGDDLTGSKWSRHWCLHAIHRVDIPRNVRTNHEKEVYLDKIKPNCHKNIFSYISTTMRNMFKRGRDKDFLVPLDRQLEQDNMSNTGRRLIVTYVYRTTKQKKFCFHGYGCSWAHSLKHCM